MSRDSVARRRSVVRSQQRARSHLPRLGAGSVKVDWRPSVTVAASLFVIAAFEKGMTHDLLLEAGVFLVSCKFIIGSYKAEIAERRTAQDLADIKRALALVSPGRSGIQQ